MKRKNYIVNSSKMELKHANFISEIVLVRIFKPYEPFLGEMVQVVFKNKLDI